MQEPIIDFKVPEGWRRPKTHFIDATQKRFLDLKVAEELKDMGSSRSQHEELVRRLLLLGGDQVCLCFEEDIQNILSRAEACKGSKSRKKKGLPCRCHQNAAWMWKDHPKTCRVATGWALSRDGIWRQHSWIVEPLVNWDLSGYQIIETTERRMVYYGFMLTEEECQKFYYNQT